MTTIPKLLETPDVKKQEELNKFASKVFYMLEDEVKKGKLTYLDCLGAISNFVQKIVEHQGGGSLCIYEREYQTEPNTTKLERKNDESDTLS